MTTDIIRESFVSTTEESNIADKLAIVTARGITPTYTQSDEATFRGRGIHDPSGDNLIKQVDFVEQHQIDVTQSMLDEADQEYSRRLDEVLAHYMDYNLVSETMTKEQHATVVAGVKEHFMKNLNRRIPNATDLTINFDGSVTINDPVAVGRGLTKPTIQYVDLRDIYEATVEKSAAKGELAEKLYPTKASD